MEPRRLERLFRPIADAPAAHRALLAVALNPNAPPEVLSRLAALPQAHRFLAERDSALSRELLSVLLTDPDTWTSRALAAKPTTPWAIRCELAESSDVYVRAAAAQTGRLADDPEACAQLERLLRALAADHDPVVRAAVAGNPQLPVDLVPGLARDPESSVRLEVARRRYLPESAATWRELLADPDVEVRAAARRQALRNCEFGLSEETAAEIADDPDWFVRILLAVHLRLPAAAIDRLSGDRSAGVRATIATRGDISSELRETLIAGLSGGRDEERLRTLSADFFFAAPEFDDGSRGAAVGSTEAGLACLRSANPFLRRAAALSAPLPRQALAELFDDPDSEVACAAVRRHPDPPAAVVERSAVRLSGGWWPGFQLLRHRSFPPDAWARLADHEEWFIRREACRYPHLPAEILARLARDTEPKIRAAAAQHPNLPMECIAALVVDEGRTVAESMGGSPALTVDWMRQLLIGAGL